MTTIAADAKAGVMVSDSEWTDGDEKGPYRKVWRIRGELCGFAGDHKAMMQTRDWMRAGQVGPRPTGNVTVLILNQRGLRTWNPIDGTWVSSSPQFAIGSGAKAARAAMLAGADCKAAVKIACQVDAESGGRPRVYKLG